MSIISDSLVSSNLNFAINNITTTLTAVTSTGVTVTFLDEGVSTDVVFKANKQDMEITFSVFENGVEDTVDTKFFINKSAYPAMETAGVLPKKGTLLTDGTRTYKVVTKKVDSKDVTLQIECHAQYQRS